MVGRVLQGHPGIGPRVEGKVLAGKDNFSARYDLDRSVGVFSRPQHALYGKSYVDRILVLDIAKGGVATAWMLNDMKLRGLAPRALLLNRANPIMAQGAAFAGMAMIDRFETDITEALSTGMRVLVDPGTGRIEILE